MGVLTPGRSDMKKILVFAVTLSFCGVLGAQSYPSRPIKVVVPWPPGQATDIAARVVAERLQHSLGQPFVIANRPGAGGAIASDLVPSTPPYAHTPPSASTVP